MGKDLPETIEKLTREAEKLGRELHGGGGVTDEAYNNLLKGSTPEHLKEKVLAGKGLFVVYREKFY